MLVLLLLLCSLAGVSLAQEDKAKDKLTPDTIATQLIVMQERITRTEAWLKTVSPSLATEAKAQLRWLRKIEAIYKAQLTGIKRQESLNADLMQQDKLKDDDVSQQLEKPPYTLNYYDRFLDEVDAIAQQKKVCEISIKTEISATENVRAQVESIKRRIRTASENGGAGDDKLKLELQFAEASLERHRLALENNRLELLLAESKAEIAKRRIDWIKKQLRFNAVNLKTQLEKVAARRKVLEDSQETLSAELNAIENEWQTARSKPVRGEAVSQDFDLLHQARQKTFDQTENLLQIINQEEQLWQHRYELLRKRPVQTTLKDWADYLTTFKSSLNRQLELLQEEQLILQPQIASLYKELNVGDQPAGASQKRAILVALSQQIKSGIEYHSELKNALTLAERLSNEIGLSLKKVTPRDVLSVTWHWTQKIWNFELWVIEDHPVTVKKVLIAIVILIVGIGLAKAFMSSFVKRLERAARINKNSIPIISKTVYYSILLVVILFTLRTVRIPLTAFTFLGGALAIGIGFGAQNLISNFISGFIIMMEQPIRIGDQVEIEGRVGVIKEIGARCTRVQTFDNVDILVPNSFFLEKSITNRSKVDEICRAKVTLGVAYGSDTRKVEDLLLKLAKENTAVLNDPASFVLFQNFGNSTLDFELFIWLKLADLGRVPSEIRHAIATTFPQEGIDIAFPQLDVHLKQG